MSEQNNDGAAMAAESDEWNPVLRRVHTGHPKEFHCEGADGRARRFRLAEPMDKNEAEAREFIGHSLLGESLLVQTDNMVPEEAIVYVDNGTPDFPRLGIAREVLPPSGKKKKPEPPFAGGWEPKEEEEMRGES